MAVVLDLGPEAPVAVAAARSTAADTAAVKSLVVDLQLLSWVVDERGCPPRKRKGSWRSPRWAVERVFLAGRP